MTTNDFWGSSLLERNFRPSLDVYAIVGIESLHAQMPRLENNSNSNIIEVAIVFFVCHDQSPGIGLGNNPL